ncbi:MAG: hypothetical protein IPN01_29255 [Deltaproteobacteria bacterium]|nr:hypothetical protein [Deltaproteobacteria bacterium]
MVHRRGLPLALFLDPTLPSPTAPQSPWGLGLGALLVLLGALRLGTSPQGRSFAGLGVVLVAEVTTSGLLMEPGRRS